MQERAETLTEATATGSDEVRFWAAQLNLASKVEEKWRQKAQALQKRYRNGEDCGDARLNIFWSNVQVLKPALYSQTPRPDVRRRTIHELPAVRQVGLQAAKVIERQAAYAMDDGYFGPAMEKARDDALIVGRR
jgi:hypothetical protein